jgi:hypothetical protein
MGVHPDQGRSNMRKIKTVFMIDRENGHVALNAVMPGSEWVLEGKGIATIKHDGTSCMVRDGKLYKRYDAKSGKQPPVGWEPCEDVPDAKTGHWPGWLLVTEAPENRWHLEALSAAGGVLEDGTYELVGPKVQGNKYGLERHELWRHGSEVVTDVERSFDGIRAWLETHKVEGLVFHYTDVTGTLRMAKARRKDFKLTW